MRLASNGSMRLVAQQLVWKTMSYKHFSKDFEIGLRLEGAALNL